MIEMDIHETKDGHFIVHHDNSLGLKAPSWNELTLPEIKAKTKNRAPLLQDCLKVIKSTPVDLEVKNCLNIENLVEQLEALPLSEGSVLSSFNLDLLKALSIRKIRLPLFLVTSLSSKRSFSHNIRSLTISMSPWFFPRFLDGVAVHRSLAHPHLIRGIHRLRKQIFIWDVDQLSDMKKVLNWRADGLITSFPLDLRKLSSNC